MTTNPTLTLAAAPVIPAAVVSLRDYPEIYNYYASRSSFSSDEERGGFERLTDDYLTDFRPSGRFEIDCVVEMARSRWELDLAHQDENTHTRSIMDEAVAANPTHPPAEVRARLLRRYDWRNDPARKYIQGRIRYWRSTYNAAYAKFRTQQANRQELEAAAAESAAEATADINPPLTSVPELIAASPTSICPETAVQDPADAPVSIGVDIDNPDREPSGK